MCLNSRFDLIAPERFTAVFEHSRTTCFAYGVAPKGLLTFLGSLYKEVAKTTSGTLVGK